MKIFVLIVALMINSCWAQNLNNPVTNVSQIIGRWERFGFSEEMKKQMNEAEPWATLVYGVCTSDVHLSYRGGATYEYAKE